MPFPSLPFSFQTLALHSVEVVISLCSLVSVLPQCPELVSFGWGGQIGQVLCNYPGQCPWLPSGHSGACFCACVSVTHCEENEGEDCLSWLGERQCQSDLEKKFSVFKHSQWAAGNLKGFLDRCGQQ